MKLIREVENIKVFVLQEAKSAQQCVTKAVNVVLQVRESKSK